MSRNPLVKLCIAVAFCAITPAAASEAAWTLRMVLTERDNASGVRRIVFHPADATVAYAILTATGRLARSNDGGNTWRELSALGASDITADPTARDHVLIATDKGLLQSLDQGETWIHLSDDVFSIAPLPPTVTAVAVNPHEPESIYVSAPAMPGVFKSGDRGRTWTLLLRDHAAGEFAFDATDASTVYARITYPEADAGVAVSKDGGTSWRFGSYNFVSTIATSPRDSLNIWATLNQSLCRTLWVSRNGAVTWRVTEIAGCSEGPREKAPTAIAVDPRDSRIVYVGTEGAGVLWTVDGGVTWMQLNDGLTELRITAIAADLSLMRLLVGTAESTPPTGGKARIYSRPLPDWPARRRAVSR